MVERDEVWVLLSCSDCGKETSTTGTYEHGRGEPIAKDCRCSHCGSYRTKVRALGVAAFRENGSKHWRIRSEEEIAHSMKTDRKEGIILD